MALTRKQQIFVDAYIETANATEAAKRAGYSEKTAGSMGAENLTKPEVVAYIAERFSQQDKERVAAADEVLRFYSAVMRGEVLDQFGMEAALSERLKAADSLMKRYSAADDKYRGTMAKLDGLLKEFKDAINTEAN